MSADRNDMLKNDLEKFRQLSSQETTVPAMVELAFGSLTAVAALVWLLAIFWVPDPIDGQTWLSLGLIGLVLFGVPAAGVFVLRRGGIEILLAIVRDIAR